MRSFGAGAAVLLALAGDVSGHAYMTQPASRMAHAHQATPRTEFEPQSAGGGGGYAPCGKIGGHDYTDDAWNADHAAGHQVVVKGGVLQTEVTVTAHHWGHFEFSMCDLDSLNLAGKSKSEKDALIWECFNTESNLLPRHPDYEAYDPAPIDSNHPTRWYLPPKGDDSWPPQGWTGAPAANSGKKVYRMWLKVPTNVNCDGDNCLLFYFYYSSNSCEAAGYRTYMSGSAPAQVKNWFNDREDKAWTCASCGECKDTTGAEDGTVKNGKRAFDDEVSLGSPERFYGCADLSTVTGIAQASDLPAACPGGWCAEQNCACNGQPSTLAPTVPSTPSPSAAPSTGSPSTATAAPSAATATPTVTGHSNAPSQASTGAPSKSPTTGAPTATGSTGACADVPTCTSRPHDAGMLSCGACQSYYCHGNAVMMCPSGLVFNAGGFCNWPAAEGCQGNQGFAAARAGDAEAAETKGSSTLVTMLAVAVAALSGCVVALLVVHARRRTVAGDESMSHVVVDGTSMRAGPAHAKFAPKKTVCDV